MKLLENTNFERLSDALSTEDSMDGRIDARIESYRSELFKDLLLVDRHRHFLNVLVQYNFQFNSV